VILFLNQLKQNREAINLWLIDKLIALSDLKVADCEHALIKFTTFSLFYSFGFAINFVDAINSKDSINFIIVSVHMV